MNQNEPRIRQTLTECEAFIERYHCSPYKPHLHEAEQLLASSSNPNGAHVKLRFVPHQSQTPFQKDGNFQTQRPAIRPVRTVQNLPGLWRDKGLHG